MGIKVKNSRRKMRVNITVDKELLTKAKKKLGLFGGKMSTLFNAYLNDFVKTMDNKVGAKKDEVLERVKDLEERIKRLENKS